MSETRHSKDFKQLLVEIKARQKQGLPVDKLQQRQLEILLDTYDKFGKKAEEERILDKPETYLVKLSYVEGIIKLKRQLNQPVDEWTKTQDELKGTFRREFGYTV